MSTLKTLIGKSDSFKGFLEFLLSSVGSSWMPHLSQSLKKILGSICFSFFSALFLVLLSLKLHSLKSAQYFTFPLSLHGKSACGVESPSTGSGCPPQLCNHVVCMEGFTLHRAAVSLAWECEKELHFCLCFGEGAGGTECAALFRRNIANLFTYRYVKFRKNADFQL